ncbi:EAL domain-containing protein [Vibrio harveyi]
MQIELSIDIESDIEFVFQEIYSNISNNIVGLEIFSQLNSNLVEINDKFETLDYDDIKNLIIYQIKYIEKLSYHLPISINIPLPCLSDNEFISYLLFKREVNFIIEVTDINDKYYDSYLYSLLKLKEVGFQLYLDEVDFKDKNVDTILQFNWDFIKIDLNLETNKDDCYTNFIQTIRNNISENTIIYYNTLSFNEKLNCHYSQSSDYIYIDDLYKKLQEVSIYYNQNIH